MVKGGTELLQDPVALELLASRIAAQLAYNWTDGTPRVVSIWFHWDGTDIVLATLPGAPKLKALQSGDRVALTIDTNDPPHHILSIRGTAEVTQILGVVPEYAQAAVRYLGSAQGEALCWVAATGHQDGSHRRASRPGGGPRLRDPLPQPGDVPTEDLAGSPGPPHRLAVAWLGWAPVSYTLRRGPPSYPYEPGAVDLPVA